MAKNAQVWAKFLSELDTRDMKKEEKLFCTRMKAALTGNTDNFPFKPDDLLTITPTDLDRAGFDKDKFKNVESRAWEYDKRSKSVVEDPFTRSLVREYFELDTITIEGTDPRTRETVTVEGIECLRRFFLDSVENLVEKFLKDNPNVKASKSSIKKILRSYPHFRYATESERLHSACRYCRQLQMFTDTINQTEAFDRYFMRPEELVEFSCCRNSNELCGEDICSSCESEKGKALAKEQLELLLLYGDVTEELTWVVLGKDENNKEGEAQVNGTISQFIDEVATFLSRGCESSGTGRKPAAHLNRLEAMKRERRNIFRQLNDDKELLVCEIDHGDQSE